MALGLQVEDMADLRDLLIPIMKSIAMTVGPRCEVVLHDFRALASRGSTIMWIENGHVTGRYVGGPTTNLGLEALKTGDPSPDRFNYRTRTADGRELRSSSIYFRNRAGELIGALCLNIDVRTYVHARDALDELIGRDDEAALEIDETFGTDIGDVLDDLVRRGIQRRGLPVTAMSRDDKVAVVGYLDEKGAFLVKRAIDRVARALKISRVTAYAYLDEARTTASAAGGGPNGRG